VTKARLVYLLVIASTFAYVLIALTPFGTSDGGVY
jgi:hypothetical protein